MFTGIIESLGIVKSITQEDKNIHLEIQCDFVSELKIDQSIAHNGVCLTVVKLLDHSFIVTAIDETISKTTLGKWQINDKVNLERAAKLSMRLDGHIVQGHVDQTATCQSIKENKGSWVFHFQYDPSYNNITVEKGSICIDGVSLTVLNSQKDGFSVAIIPYTFEQTNFKNYVVGTEVNLEFDIIGKYVKRLYELSN